MINLFLAMKMAIKSKILKKLRNHGGLVRNVHEYIGYNSRLDEIQASILNTKLKIIEKLNIFRPTRINGIQYYYNIVLYYYSIL